MVLLKERIKIGRSKRYLDVLHCNCAKYFNEEK